MNDTIMFPGLHITLNHVGRSINVFGYRIAFYGIVIAIGMLLGSYIILKEAKRRGFKEDDFLDIIIWSLIIGVIGARAYYVAFAWDTYKYDLPSIFNIRQGGLAIYGGIIAGVITAFIVTKKKKMNFVEAADIAIIGLPVGQCIGRWGNFFNREAFGDYSDGLFRMLIPLNQVRSRSDVTIKMLNNTVTIGKTEFISVHPTFLYESIWTLMVFIVIFIMRKHIRFNGQQFLTYVVLYGIGRFWIEGLRTDQLILWNTNIPVSQLLSALGVIVGIALLIMGNLKASAKKKAGIIADSDKDSISDAEEADKKSTEKNI